MIKYHLDRGDNQQYCRLVVIHARGTLVHSAGVTYILVSG